MRQLVTQKPFQPDERGRFLAEGPGEFWPDSERSESPRWRGEEGSAPSPTCAVSHQEDTCS